MTTASAQETEQKEEKIIQKSVNIGLVYPISTTGLNAPRTSNYFSANAIGGISYDELSFCGSGFTNVVKHDARGLIAAGFSNHIMNDAKGLQAAGFVNTVRNNTTGLAAAGFVNYSGSMRGTQLAGFANITRYETKGVQAAGFANVSKDADVQLGGFMNVAKETKTQFAGFINAGKNTNTQIAGFINAAKDVKGAQVAGFINVAKKVEGAQIAGFINIADSCDYPIGLVNIVKNGEKNIGVTVDESLTTMVTFRSGGKKLYGILGVGANMQQNVGDIFNYGDWPFYALEGGLGAHIPIVKNFRVNLEGVATSLSDFYVGYYVRTSLRILPSVTIGKHTEIFAGPTLNVEHSNISRGGGGIATNYIWGTNLRNSLAGLYLGAMGGIAYKF
jgi:hypothetical protein